MGPTDPERLASFLQAHPDPFCGLLRHSGIAIGDGEHARARVNLVSVGKAVRQRGGQKAVMPPLHSCHAVALSLMPDADKDSFLPPLTPYGIMKLGRVKLLPFFLPGDPAMGQAIRGLAGKRSAVMLADHGPVVAGKDVEAACNAIEELEDSARLAMLTRGLHPRALSPDQVQALVTKFDVDWDD
ncbi:class II aldolase/adducin family protein [Sulfitobacter sediminis]|uniref:class II aldolase/adducin family protein n=1 Tax=Sulfitobacter sediminis TaxID=3234186 RepID=UPI003B2154EB